MNKSIVALCVATLLTSVSAIAQQEGTAGSGATAGGAGAAAGATGAVATATIVAGVVGAAVVAGVVANSSGTSEEDPTVEEELTCDSDDELVDDLCVGTETTVTVSGTQIITVTNTFTYEPTVQ